ncbi:MAG: LLM class flavin-dependent oxidoreductase [Micromonosporaceae bacterium]|nr:LLM class flavin-dependent oxidoreductase [Micromonosporaceae bacterium]
MRCGVLLPHFGSRSYPARMLDSLEPIEGFGFDSIWVRDHFLYPPELPGDDGTFVDPIVVLAAAAASTRRVVLGTAVLAPHRHPVHLATLLSSLASLAGGERLIVGLGTGSRTSEMVAAGLPATRRGRLLEEQVDVIRALWTSRTVDHRGPHYRLDQVRLSADESLAHAQLWYGGITTRAVERTVARFDGLLLSRLPIEVTEQRVALLRRRSAAQGRAAPPVGLVVQASPGHTRQEALRAVDVPRIIDQSARYLNAEVTSPAGLLVAGTPADLVAGLSELARAGVDHVVLDMRARFADWEDCLQLVGEAVLPELRRAGVLAPGTGRESC